MWLRPGCKLTDTSNGHFQPPELRFIIFNSNIIYDDNMVLNDKYYLFLFFI